MSADPAYRPRDICLCALVGCLWVAFCSIVVLIKHPEDFGGDQTQIYQAGLLYAHGAGGAIYSVDAPGLKLANGRLADPATFNVTEALNRHITGEDARPFTQTPLFAAIVAPIVSRLTFPAFNLAMMVLNLAAYATSMLLAILAWRPQWCVPHRYLAALVLTMVTTPFESAISLNQIQMVVVMLIVLAILLDQRSCYRLAGAAAALAIALKITPIVLIPAWLASRHYRTAAWAVVGLALIAALSIAVAGLPLNLAFLARLSALSHEVMSAINDQSLRCVVYTALHPGADLLWHAYPLPPEVQWIERAATVVFMGGFALLWWRLRHEDATRILVVYSLCATLVLPPIVWDHYSILVPFLLMAIPAPWLGGRRAAADPTPMPRYRIAWIAVIASIAALELSPVLGVLLWRQFYAAVILSVALVALARPARAAEPVRGS